MLAWADKQTTAAINSLTQTVRSGKLRIVLWVGAGASSWCGYPLWGELADNYHSASLRFEASYDAHHASALRSRSLPLFFGYCRSVSPQRYRQMLTEIFATRPAPPVYQRFVRAIQTYSRCCVVFFGYGLGDEYVIRLLAESADIHTLFGDGPHFAILPERKPDLSSSVRQIIYCAEPGSDHRAAIRVLEEMTFFSNGVFSLGNRKMDLRPVELKSAHFISDVVPPGTWVSSQTFRFGPNDTDFLAYVGHGIKEEELPDRNSTAMHDLAVGFLSFDEVFVPLKSAYRVYDLLGAALFWHLVHAGALRFVHWESEELIVYDDEPHLTHGSVGSVNNCKVQTVDESISSQMEPKAGREMEAEIHFERLRSATVSLPNSELPVIPDLVRGLLLFPSIRRAIGMSDGISSVSIPHWLAFPVLRLAHVVRVGITCNSFTCPVHETAIWRCRSCCAGILCLFWFTLGRRDGQLRAFRTVQHRSWSLHP